MEYPVNYNGSLTSPVSPGLTSALHAANPFYYIPSEQNFDLKVRKVANGFILIFESKEYVFENPTILAEFIAKTLK